MKLLHEEPAVSAEQAYQGAEQDEGPYSIERIPTDLYQYGIFFQCRDCILSK